MHAPFRHAAFALLLALLPVLAWAQTPPQAGLDFPAPGFEPVFERFDEKDGLPQSAANTLLQASDGSERGKGKLWTPTGGRWFGCLTASELGLSFGRAAEQPFPLAGAR